MTDGVDSAAPPQANGPTITAIPSDPRGWLRRHWWSVLAGVIPGVYLGLRTAQMVTEGGLSALAPIFDLSLIAPTVVVLLIIAALAKRSGPAIAALALVGSWLLSWLIGTFIWK